MVTENTSTGGSPVERGVSLRCAECGMDCEVGEFHPYAACLMFKACHDSSIVRANLPYGSWDEKDKLALRNACENLALRERLDYVAGGLRDNVSRLEDVVWDIEQLENWKTDMHLLGIHEVCSQALASLGALREQANAGGERRAD